MSKFPTPYSLIKKGSKEYRNALRSIRRNYKRYGAKFDYSELWNLDKTIYKYVYIHKLFEHPFLHQCAFGDIYMYSKYWEQQGMTKEEYNENYRKYLDEEDKFYTEIDFKISQLTDKKFFEFLLPRLKAFKDTTIAHPIDMTFEEYQEYLQNVIDEIETKGTCTLIYDKYITLWF